MALTPMDIYNKEFKTAWKGYNREQVDAFLDQVIVDFKSLLEGDGEVKTNPDEVRLKRFGRATRGYDPDDVDAYLLDVAKEFADLLAQRRRAEEVARARKAGRQPAAEPGAAATPAPVVEPAYVAPPAPVVEPAYVAPPAPVVEPAYAAPPAPVVEPAYAAPPAPVVEPAYAAPPAPVVEPAYAAPQAPVVAPIAAPVTAPATVTTPTPIPPRTGAAALPAEIPAGAGTIRLSLSGGRLFLTLEAQDLTVRRELDREAAHRLGEALLRMTDSLEG